jgi:hypothetical protein
MIMLTPTAIAQLDQLQTQLPQVLTGQLRASELIATARQSQALIQALPEKFDRVLQDILDRLESGALFTEESCSFSQRDLLDSLALWIEKARNALGGVHTAH